MGSLPFNPAAQRYISLATYRRNGAEVRTPVWVAQSGEHFVLFSAADTGKVKRIRATPRARIAPCSAQGEIRGPWMDVSARIIDGTAEVNRAYAALRKKYTWQMGLVDFFSRLFGKIDKRVLIELQAVERAT